MTRTLRFVAGVCIVFAFQIHYAFADRIVGVTATTTMGSGLSTSLINAVNGMGLSALSLTATHEATGITNSWVSAPGMLTGSVTFALGASHQVDSFSFWNQNGGGPGIGTAGIQAVQVLVSTDGLSFALLPGSPTLFAQVPGFSALPPQVFTFAPVTATHFRFDISSNYGDTAQTGFAEVGFNSIAVPEPSAAQLLVAGLTLIALFRRQRRFSISLFSGK